jgi:hypothetical protein
MTDETLYAINKEALRLAYAIFTTKEDLSTDFHFFKTLLIEGLNTEPSKPIN